MTGRHFGAEGGEKGEGRSPLAKESGFASREGGGGEKRDQSIHLQRGKGHLCLCRRDVVPSVGGEKKS